MALITWDSTVSFELQADPVATTIAFDVLPDAEHKLLALASHIVLFSYLEQ